MRSVGVMVLLLMVIVAAVGQNNAPDSLPGFIKPYQLSVCLEKTTNLIFPYSIKSVDRGSAAIVVQKARGVENILQVKAGKKQFAATNLSIVTADGKFYSFLVQYDNDPKELSIRFDNHFLAQFPKGSVNEQQLEREAYAVKVQESGRLKKASGLGITVKLEGIFFSNEHMWFKFYVCNNAPIAFRPASVRFFVRNRQRARRTAMQETEAVPICHQSPKQVDHHSCDYVLLAFSSFFMPKEKYLMIQMGDPNNGTAISMKVRHSLFVKGNRLPE